MDLEHEQRLSKVEERAKSNSHRIEELEKRQNNLDDLAAAVKVLAVREENVETDVKEIKSDVKTLTNKGGQRWDTLTTVIITALASGIITYFLSNLLP